MMMNLVTDKDATKMPEDTGLTKIERWAVDVLADFADAVQRDHLTDFLHSEELERFLHNATGGSFGDKVPDDGTPGSKIPAIGKDPLSVVRGLFGGIGSDLGKVDHPGGSDPAAQPDDVPVVSPDGTRTTTHTDPITGDRTTVITWPNGVIGAWTVHPDGSADGMELFPDGKSALVHVDQTPSHRTDFGAGSRGRGSSGLEFDIYPGANPRDTIVFSFQHKDGAEDKFPRREVWHREHSPGEDGGGDSNSGRNPLSGLEEVGPQSMQQMLASMKHPGRDSDEYDPNTGKGEVKFTEKDKEHLGRTVTAAEVLDPNSGVDPLTQLNIDPNQVHTRTEKDDRVDKNTGLDKPRPGS